MTAFSNKQSQIGDLLVDRAEDKIVLKGRLEISHSQKGLADARELLALLREAVEDLQNLSLPEKEEIILPTVRANPYKTAESFEKKRTKQKKKEQQ